MVLEERYINDNNDSHVRCLPMIGCGALQCGLDLSFFLDSHSIFLHHPRLKHFFAAPRVVNIRRLLVVTLDNHGLNNVQKLFRLTVPIYRAQKMYRHLPQVDQEGSLLQRKNQVSGCAVTLTVVTMDEINHVFRNDRPHSSRLTIPNGYISDGGAYTPGRKRRPRVELSSAPEVYRPRRTPGRRA